MRSLKLLSVLCIAGILSLSFFSWYSCDDFCNRIELARYSVLKMAWLQYMNWDGRSLNIASFVQLICLKYFPVELTTLLWGLSFVTTAALIVLIIRIGNPFFFSGSASIIGTAIVCATMWLGMWKLIPDIIYWPTGGSYSLLNMMGILWLYILLLGLKTKNFGTKALFFILVFSFICGMNSHNLIPGLCVICLIELCYCLIIDKNKRASVYISCALIGLLIGACIVFLSPGNQVRLSIISYPGFSMNFIYYYFLVLSKYIYWLLSLLFLFVFFAWLSGKKKYFQSKSIAAWFHELKNFPWKKHSILVTIHRHEYLIAAFATIAVFSATPFFATPRTAIFFSTLLVIWIFRLIWNEEKMVQLNRLKYGSFIFLSIFIGILIFQMFRAYPVKRELAEREELFKNRKGMDVTVPAIAASRIPFAFTFTDITSDTGNWVNRCAAQYYELKTVRTDTY